MLGLGDNFDFQKMQQPPPTLYSSPNTNMFQYLP